MVQSVQRAITLLLALERGPQSLARLVEATGLSKATAHRLLASLSFGQLVAQDPVGGEYLLGPGCIGIGDAVMRGFGGLNVIAGPVLERLGLATQETVALHVRMGVSRICVGQHQSPQQVRYVARVGAAQPLYLGAMGKVILAFSDLDVRTEILDRTALKPVTDRTITDRAVLERELDEIRTKGFGTSFGENVTGAATISAPVLTEDGAVAAAVSIIGPDSRLSPQAIIELLPALLATAEDVGTLLAATNAESGQNSG